MFEWFIKNLSKDNRGFTLIELVVVIAILAILALIAVPRFAGTTDKAAVSAHNANVRTLESAANMFIAENPGEGTKWTKDNKEGNNDGKGWENYVQEWPEVPDGIEGADYEVTITKEGEITVTPAKQKENK